MADREVSGSKLWAHGLVVWVLYKETNLVRSAADRRKPSDSSPSVQPRDRYDTRNEATSPAYARREAEITPMGHARGPLPWSSRSLVIDLRWGLLNLLYRHSWGNDLMCQEGDGRSVIQYGNNLWSGNVGSLMILISRQGNGSCLRNPRKTILIGGPVPGSWKPSTICGSLSFTCHYADLVVGSAHLPAPDKGPCSVAPSGPTSKGLKGSAPTM
ncbi:uncharacterized protein LY79DRAFT_657038 [Colletotrichum navitas]|uniref:Uncharacterized protein n=1 Tax=Colletotrichum navitas TaxID=681940 RepID=A0AAD8Q767_9PEZI|nr:uncharacterized protein LY79DRAFT_657038 [Colletotrichum navitas]KAK1596576.1 hypothetical protein LY79DRAFT_657038 [Colletotrichum navitas]